MAARFVFKYSTELSRVVFHLVENLEGHAHTRDLLDRELKFVVHLFHERVLGMVDDVVDEILVCLRLEIGRLAVGDEEPCKAVVAQDYLLESKLAGDPAQAHRVEQVVGLCRNGSEAVYEVVGEAHQAFLVLNVVQLGVERNAFR